MKANLPPPKPPDPQPEPPQTVPPVPPVQRAPAFGQRQKIAAAVLLVALVGGGVWWWLSREHSPEPPLPAGITDTEVSAAIAAARAKVVEEPRSADAWGEYGTVLHANLFDRDAVTCYIEAGKLDPKDSRWPYARGLIALVRDPPNALALLEAATEAARDHPRLRPAITLTFAEALLERGQVDRAAGLFESQLTSTAAARAQYGLGMVALQRGDDATALQRFEAVKSNPSCRKQANGHLARLAFARGDKDAAKQYQAEADGFDDDPPWPDPFQDRMVDLQVGERGLRRRIGTLERDGRYEEAANAYLAQARHKRTADALAGAGVNLARLKDYDTAISLLREAVAIDSADSNAHYTLALVLFNKAEKMWVADPASTEAAALFREVVTEAKKATELKPDHARAFMWWGLSLKNLGEPKAAIEPLRQGLVIRPGEFDLHLGLGQCLAATGDRVGAEASFNAAAKLRPKDPRPTDELAKLNKR